MKLEVKEYREDGGYHVCRAEDGQQMYVDLLVDGTLPDDFAEEPTKLIGRTVDVSGTHAYISIADDVRLIA